MSYGRSFLTTLTDPASDHSIESSSFVIARTASWRERGGNVKPRRQVVRRPSRKVRAPRRAMMRALSGRGAMGSPLATAWGSGRRPD